MNCRVVLIAAALLVAAPAFAQEDPALAGTGAPPVDIDSPAFAAGRRAGNIVTQPARDVGLSKTNTPLVLASASEHPYSLEGVETCEEMSRAVAELTDVLGPDYTFGDAGPENKTGKVAEAGGRMLVNSLIPFRGIVREISGAAPAERKLNEAVSAGFARRGFLRGVATTKGCP